jgi:PAS domain S-box-containing protein
VAPTYETPTGTTQPAAAIHALMAETILARAWVRRPDALVAAEIATAVALALVAGVAVTNVPAAVTLLGCALALLALWGGSVALVQHAGLLASPVLPAGVVVTSGGALLAVTSWLRQRDARRRTADALVLMRRSEHELSSILGTIPDIVFRLDAAGRITFISPAVSKYRARPEHLIGQPMLELVTPDDRSAAMWRVNERRTGPRATRDLEVRLLLTGEDGEQEARYFSVSAEGIYTADRPGPATFAGTQGIARDVDERRRLEAQLAHARQMEAMGTLAAGVAHDLNNILGALVGYPELLLLDLPPDSPMRESLQSIQASGQRAAAIVQDMLTIARRGVRTHEVVNLNEAVAAYLASPECRRLQEQHPGVRCETDLGPALMNTLGSSVHLSKVIMNMVGNSAEAMPAGGRICLATRNCYVDQELQAFERIPEGEYVVLSVIDDGVGIGAEHLPRIFEPFYSKKKLGRSGSGLGMAVVWSTVKDHGGFVDVVSQEGEGTRFDLYFPVTRRERHGAGADVVLEDYVGTERVLVVDDVPEQLTIAVRMLGKLGYDVATASSGEQAVASLQERPVDLVVLDMVMPTGMDGLETFRRIREIHPRQRAIIASGYSESDRVVAAQAMGAGAYVRKPYTLETIGLAVRHEIDRGHA